MRSILSLFIRNCFLFFCILFYCFLISFCVFFSSFESLIIVARFPIMFSVLFIARLMFLLVVWRLLCEWWRSCIRAFVSFHFFPVVAAIIIFNFSSFSSWLNGLHLPVARSYLLMCTLYENQLHIWCGEKADGRWWWFNGVDIVFVFVFGLVWSLYSSFVSFYFLWLILFSFVQVRRELENYVRHLY